jgi:hypothetical protein
MTLWDYYTPKRSTVRLLGKLYMTARGALFTKKMKDAKYLRIDISIANLEMMLREVYYDDWSEFSFHYEGEDLNMRRPFYMDGEQNDYQHHIRAWGKDNKVYLRAHNELCAKDHPVLHLKAKGLNHDKGMADLESLLQTLGIPYDKVKIKDGEVTKDA